MFFLKYTEIPKSICKGRKKQLQASSMQEGKKAFKENIPDTDKQLQEKKQKKQQQQPQQLRKTKTKNKQDVAMYKRDKKIITVSSKLIRGLGTSFKHSHQAVSSFTILSLNMAKIQNQEVRCSFDKNNKTVKTVQHLPQFTLSDSQVFKHAQYSPVSSLRFTTPL